MLLLKVPNVIIDLYYSSLLDKYLYNSTNVSSRRKSKQPINRPVAFSLSYWSGLLRFSNVIIVVKCGKVGVLMSETRELPEFS